MSLAREFIRTRDCPIIIFTVEPFILGSSSFVRQRGRNLLSAHLSAIGAFQNLLRHRFPRPSVALRVSQLVVRVNLEAWCNPYPRRLPRPKRSVPPTEAIRHGRKPTATTRGRAQLIASSETFEREATELDIANAPAPTAIRAIS